jgi:hypothetical protein
MTNNQSLKIQHQPFIEWKKIYLHHQLHYLSSSVFQLQRRDLWLNWAIKLSAYTMAGRRYEQVPVPGTVPVVNLLVCPPPPTSGLTATSRAGSLKIFFESKWLTLNVIIYGKFGYGRTILPKDIHALDLRYSSLKTKTDPKGLARLYCRIDRLWMGRSRRIRIYIRNGFRICIRG